MLNVLKNALIYTGIYFIITTVVFWTIFFVHVAVLVFWKPMLLVFAILVLVFTWDYLKARKVLGKFNLRPSGNRETDIKAFATELFK